MGFFRGAIAIIALQFVAAAHASSPNLEGVWIIEKAVKDLKPEGLKAIPFTAEGRAKYNENKALAAKKDFSFDYTYSRCSSPGMPRMMLTAEPFKIIQRPEMIYVVFKWNQLARQIDLRQEQPKPISTEAEFFIPTMRGDTKGQWDGGALVARTTGLSPDKLLDNLLPNSDELQLTERLSLLDANRLEDRITITDPMMYTQPWVAIVTYKRLSDDAYPFAEDVCLDRKTSGKGTWPR